MKKSTRTNSSYKDYIKANRKGSRDAELEDSTGWSAKHKVHVSSKAYSRKMKYKNFDEEE
jgi:hypothetical protein